MNPKGPPGSLSQWTRRSRYSYLNGPPNLLSVQQLVPSEDASSSRQKENGLTDVLWRIPERVGSLRDCRYMRGSHAGDYLFRSGQLCWVLWCWCEYDRMRSFTHYFLSWTKPVDVLRSKRPLYSAIPCDRNRFIYSEQRQRLGGSGLGQNFSLLGFTHYLIADPIH